MDVGGADYSGGGGGGGGGGAVVGGVDSGGGVENRPFLNKDVYNFFSMN